MTSDEYKKFVYYVLGNEQHTLRSYDPEIMNRLVGKIISIKHEDQKVRLYICREWVNFIQGEKENDQPVLSPIVLNWWDLEELDQDTMKGNGVQYKLYVAIFSMKFKDDTLKIIWSEKLTKSANFINY